VSAPLLTQIVHGVRGGPPLRLVAPIPRAADVTVADVTVDSRAVRPGSMFCCLRGTRVDGHAFAAAAVAAGASALLVDHELDLPVAQVVTTDTRAATGWLAASAFGHPSDSTLTIGVTGTNGKTTTAHLLGDILRASGRSVEVFGTLTGAHTTPEAPEVQRRLATCRDRGIDAVVMEVSSHALALHRVDGARFDVAVFTNLGRDHLDLHGTVERYFAAKARLFTRELSVAAVVNADDVHGRLLCDAAEIPVTSFSAADANELVVTATTHSYVWRGLPVRVRIGGMFNVMNSLAAATAATVAGLAPEVVVAGLAAARAVPGRFEPVDAGQEFSVLVDYAHTPEGLREALSAARSAAGDAHLLVVFGCGGDRDRDKRPMMGAAAAEIADTVVVTSDNPRSEAQQAIIDATVRGIPDGYRGNVVTEPDRRAAIAAAFSMARPGDVVVIAGKGHETTQTFATHVEAFDDRAVARELLEAAHR
jgi:UDP-N-acetylmuramoyl-L-alanyl-D-glutamate--2,6-diaminopimelate ligase